MGSQDLTPFTSHDLTSPAAAPAISLPEPRRGFLARYRAEKDLGEAYAAARRVAANGLVRSVAESADQAVDSQQMTGLHAVAVRTAGIHHQVTLQIVHNAVEQGATVENYVEAGVINTEFGTALQQMVLRTTAGTISREDDLIFGNASAVAARIPQRNQ